LNERRLRLELEPSPLLATALVGLHGAAAACALLVMPAFPGGLLAALLAGLGARAAWTRALLRSRASARVLELEGAHATITLGDGGTLTGEVAARRYVSRFAVTFFLRRPARRSLLVTRDMLDADSFRRLRVWALWGRLPAVATKQLAA
jgi:hypothetical protein